MLSCMDAPSCRFASDEADAFVRDEMVEGANGVAAASDAGKDSGREFPFRFQDLRYGLIYYDGMLFV